MTHGTGITGNFADSSYSPFNFGVGGTTEAFSRSNTVAVYGVEPDAVLAAIPEFGVGDPVQTYEHAPSYEA